jgi:hypothetical protein
VPDCAARSCAGILKTNARNASGIPEIFVGVRACVHTDVGEQPHAIAIHDSH